MKKITQLGRRILRKVGLINILATEKTKGCCIVCGAQSTFLSFDPVDLACKRNSFSCQKCSAISRNRHLAKIILELFPTSPLSTSLYEFSTRSTIKIFNTSVNGSLHMVLQKINGYEGSEYFEDVPSGSYINGIQCQDLLQTSYPDNTFDLIITEDVLEHVSNPMKACKEIKRILKPGGWHVATVPVNFQQQETITRAIINENGLHHLLPVEHHFDPCRTGGILVFTDFGLDLVDTYLQKIGKTVVYESHQNKNDEQSFGIYNNWVYASQSALRS